MQSSGKLVVDGLRFRRDGKPFFLHGFNYWAASTLARAGDDIGWSQVRRDLDTLQSMGVNTIRTMGGTEGPDSEPWRIVPSIQPSPGRYDPAGIEGVLRVADELRGRGLYGIFVLCNFWPWSGGMAQYLSWAGEGPIPYPPPQPGGSWDRYQDFTARFFVNERAQEAYGAYLQFLVPQLRSNPAVIWELANEPRGRRERAALRRWIDQTARVIKSLTPDQLVTTGTEGTTPSPKEAGLDLIEDHRATAIDFATFHLWAQNWGWVSPDRLAEDYPRALELARAYVRDHAAQAVTLGKPIVLEEFGFPRDGGRFEADAPTGFRDRYFEEIYALVDSLSGRGPVAGVLPWSWAGANRPPRPGDSWKRGDPFTGDPPHEPQGWYGIYATDPVVDIVRAWSSRIADGSAHTG